ncbi:FCD domain-containing protein [Micromonospora sp. CPCC 205371]|nr:FCD domain-containing protein [Micromonospora sp. CPCC 205371]
MARIAPRGIHGQTVEVLGRRIVAGEIPEGATLDITALRAELDVSLTALREALKVLSAKGIIDARQKRGTFVRPRADWHLLDRDVIRWQFAGGAGDPLLTSLHEVREIVEPAAARLAASRASASDLVALDRAIDQMAVAEGGMAATVDADIDFHRTLLAAAHNEFLQRMEVILETGLAERDRIVHGGQHDDPVPSHRAVVDAIRAGDAARAEEAMRSLLDKSIQDERNARAST